MSRKLPKATELTLDDLKRPAAEADPKAEADIPAEADPTAKADTKADADTKAGPDVMAEADDTAGSDGAALRHARAREIVERYSAYAAVGGILPVPLLDAASVFLIQVEMVRALAQHYAVPFRRDRTRAALAALATTGGQVAAGALVTTAFAKSTPGANLIGMAASSATALALARTIGHTFIDHFEEGGTGAAFDLDRLRRKAGEVHAARARHHSKPAAA